MGIWLLVYDLGRPKSEVIGDFRMFSLFNEPGSAQPGNIVEQTSCTTDSFFLVIEGR